MKLKTHPTACRSKSRRLRRGFALIITLSLMILLTVVAVGLLSLSSISLRSSSRGQAMQTAQTNARLALMMALGELQKSLGPDQRMSARARTLAKRENPDANISDSNPKAWWVGASDTNKDKDLDVGGGNRSKVVWLVSGLQGGTFTGTLSNPVDMVKDGSADLKVTGGPIQAGAVPIRNSASKETGRYAYYVDDNGMKAQLAASHPDVRNDNPLNLGGGILPGTHRLDELLGTSGGKAADTALVQKLNSARDIELLDASKLVTKSKYFGYTTRSQGVLSDTLSGGLKKDLTVAFERPEVFSKVFPSTTAQTVGKVEKVVVAPERLKEAGSDFDKGYISWATFRDYYNLKQAITTNTDGMQFLSPTLFSKNRFVTSGGGTVDSAYTDIGLGNLGPHELRGSDAYNKQFPYGEYPISTSGKAMQYRHNPVFPVLLEMWQRSWLTPPKGPSKVNATTPLTATQIETNVQLFTSHYNPYNIGIQMRGNEDKAGPRVLKFPQVIIDVLDGGTSVLKNNDRTKENLSGTNNKLQAHVDPTQANPAVPPITLEPGRSLILGFTKNVKKSDSSDGKVYFQNLADSVGQAYAAYETRDLKSALGTGQYIVKTQYAMREPAFCLGVDDTSAGDELETSQVFYSFLAVDDIPAFDAATDVRPGKEIIQQQNTTEMDDDNASGFQFSLRTTSEKHDGIRPLVDANIRAQWNNPRWDSELDLKTLAAYTLKFSDNPNEDEWPAQDSPDHLADAKTKRGFSLWGAGRTSQDGFDRVILFDVPRRDLVSLGQLQHASAGRFSYEPTYIVANSYANPRISLAQWREQKSDKFSSVDKGMPSKWKAPNFMLYDGSFLVNEALWDSYTFTTIPQKDDNTGQSPALVAASVYDSLQKRDTHLPNPRYVPYEPAGSKFDKATLQDDVSGTTTGAFFHNAGHLLVDGAFNVNSTSVDAWEAFLSGTLDLPVRKMNDKGAVGAYDSVDGVRFPRVPTPYGDGMSKASPSDENYWTGFRKLTKAEVRDIAEKIVVEIKDRGPFLTLGSFVNRQLKDGKDGKSGALQAALDDSVNKGLDEAARSGVTGNQGSGFPGQLLQGDVLQALGPLMTVHSDTFTIRAYGEARDPSAAANAAPLARAYCEAVVQRIPDPVKKSGASVDAKTDLVLPTSQFGRKFAIVSFRWLNANEI